MPVGFGVWTEDISKGGQARWGPGAVENTCPLGTGYSAPAIAAVGIQDNIAKSSHVSLE